MTQAKTTINNGDLGSTIRPALNNMFTELYSHHLYRKYSTGETGGVWYPTADYGGLGQSSTSVTGKLRWAPFVVSDTITIDAIGSGWTGAFSKSQIALYASNSSTLMPTGSPLCNVEFTPTSQSSVTSTITALTLTPGLYWVAMQINHGGNSYLTVLNYSPWMINLIGNQLGPLDVSNQSVRITTDVTYVSNSWPTMLGDGSDVTFTTGPSNWTPVVALRMI